jgi:hypothetical protein
MYTVLIHYTLQGSIDYMRNFTGAVPHGKLVMLDMRSECTPIYHFTE